jgi:hypothetical protein
LITKGFKKESIDLKKWLKLIKTTVGQTSETPDMMLFQKEMRSWRTRKTSEFLILIKSMVVLARIISSIRSIKSYCNIKLQADSIIKEASTPNKDKEETKEAPT